jgi:hypothetical protein
MTLRAGVGKVRKNVCAGVGKDGQKGVSVFLLRETHNRKMQIIVMPFVKRACTHTDSGDSRSEFARK